MIIDYDHNPALSVDQKLQSLKDSVQMALNEAGSGATTIIYRGGGGSSGGGGGSGGTTNYNDLTNKPSIEGVTLQGNKTFPNLNLNVLTNSEIQDIFDNLI